MGFGGPKVRKEKLEYNILTSVRGSTGAGLNFDIRRLHAWLGLFFRKALMARFISL
jgi:hypothetical protein